MKLAREFAVRRLDFVICRCFGDAENLVVVSELDCHCLFSQAESL
jgi:hypothetical protein